MTYLVVKINPKNFSDLLDGDLTWEDAKDMILSIDLAMMDYQFTEDLVKHLIQQLYDEVGAEFFNLQDFAPIKKET